MAAQYRIYHNPRCTKSRQTLALLHDAGITPEILQYLDSPPSSKELSMLISKLGFSSARQLIRTGEALYKELLLCDPKLSETQLIAAMVEHPKLIERPIVVKDNKAILGRPPENVLNLIG
ncbi:MAG TPA: arsenate reductase (glutaredoxin) [Cellvibrionaceae bacterium]